MLHKKSLKQIPVTVGVFGSVICEDKSVIDKTFQLGADLAKNGYRIATGACLGISQIVIAGANSANGYTIGYVPFDRNSEPEPHFLLDNFSAYDEIHHYKSLSERSLRMVDDIDIAIAIHGGIGTLSEICICLKENTPVIVLPSTGGCSKIFTEMFEQLSKG